MLRIADAALSHKPLQFGTEIHSLIIMTQFKTVARVGDIPAGEGRAYECNGRMVAVFFIDGEYQAIDDFCPHMGASLAAGPVENGTVMCPWHAWCFDLSTGCWIENPKIKADTFQVRIADGEIQVSGPNDPSPEASSTDTSGPDSPSDSG